MQLQKLKNILEALLLSADRPMDVRRLEALFEADEDRPGRDEIRQALESLQQDYQDRGIQLKQVASGYRMQVAEDNAVWVARLWEEKPPRYSRALLETLVLMAYRQPITRGEIEDIRGVSVSSHIIKTLLERDWVRVLGHKDVPGKPAMYGTTREFLDYFNLKSLDELPPLSEIKDLDKLHPELALDENAEAGDGPVDQAGGQNHPAGGPAAEAARAEADQGAQAEGADAGIDSDSTDTPGGAAGDDAGDDAENRGSAEQAVADDEPMSDESGSDESGAEAETAGQAPDEAAEQQQDDTAEPSASLPGSSDYTGEDDARARAGHPGDQADDRSDPDRELQTG